MAVRMLCYVSKAVALDQGSVCCLFSSLTIPCIQFRALLRKKGAGSLEEVQRRASSGVG